MSAQPTPEQVFLERLGALERDALAAARCAYVGSAIHFITNQQPALIPILGRDAGFWNTVLGAMRTSAIVALGRIYDSRSDVLSAPIDRARDEVPWHFQPRGTGDPQVAGIRRRRI
jgi:hypothetical protein